MTVGAGALHIPAAAGRHLRRPNTAKNLVAARRADGGLDGDHEGRLRGQRPVPPGRHDPLHRRRQLREVRPHRDEPAAGVEKFEFIPETAGRRATTRRTRPRTSRRLPEGLLPADGLRRDERDRRVLDRRHRLDPGRPRRAAAGGREDRHVRVQQRGGDGSPVADFDWFRIESGRRRRAARAATTTSPAPRWTRRAGTRSCATNPAKYAVGGGNLTITTELGDIYTGDTNPPPNNFILQAAPITPARTG